MAQRPSQVLRSFASSHEHTQFQDLLQKHVYPFLDRLPANERNNLMAVLCNACDMYKGAQLIGYESRSAVISKKLVALEKHVNADWKNGWEDQGNMMYDILGQLEEWLSLLWKVGVEMGTEHKLVHKSLKYCITTLKKLKGSRSRAEFEDMAHPDIEIMDATGRAVYRIEHGDTEHAVLWVWRELLLSAVINSKTITLAKNLVADVVKLGFAKDMLERLRDDVSAPSLRNPSGYRKIEIDDWEAERNRELLLNAHWSPEMRAAVPKVKVLFAGGST